MNYIEKSKSKFGEKFTYGDVLTVKGKKVLELHCNTHGNFQINVHQHLKSTYGCAKCGITARADNYRKTHENTFKTKANLKHNGKYTYARVLYKGAAQKVLITCQIHGDFAQTPTSHLAGKGCKLCGVTSRTIANTMALEEFTNKANIVHSHFYDYSMITKFTGTKSYYTILCPLHGEFTQKAETHLLGRNGCGVCTGKLITTDNFTARATEIHEGKYTYKHAIYTKMYSPITVTCKIHGDFTQIAHSHIKGSGCPECAGEARCKAYAQEPTILYLIKLNAFNVYKIGITLARIGLKKRYAKDKNLDYTVLREIYFLSGKHAYITEQQVLKLYKNNETFNILRGGNTEILVPKLGETFEKFISNIDTAIQHNICR